jgi:hypothetical protein
MPVWLPVVTEVVAGVVVVEELDPEALVVVVEDPVAEHMATVWHVRHDVPCKFIKLHSPALPTG